MIWGLLIGLLIGVAACFLLLRSSGAVAISALNERHQQERMDLAQRLAQAEAKEISAQQEIVRLNRELAREQHASTGLNERLQEQRAQLEALNERMTKEFRLVADGLLKEAGKELSNQQENKLKLILDPLKERIRDFEKQVKDAYESDGRERFALKSEIARLVEQNQRLSTEADNLTKALKGDSRSQGAWGEMILEKLLESSGLVAGQEYTMQSSTTLDDGSRLRPDAVISLPEGKHLIIDSKVSLLHYERFTAASDAVEKDRLIKQHVESLRSHARGLSEKDYTKLYAVNSVDFVLMFVPIEPAFLLALRERPEIFQEAYDRQVVMVTHSTLMATLRTVHGIWKNERIARNHLEIADRAGKLYDKFIGFTEDLIKVGNQLKLAKGSYDEAMNKLSEGSGNLVRRVEELKKLGAKTNKAQNAALLARAIEEHNPSEA